MRLRDQAAGLGDKLSAAVWQLPSNFKADLARLDGFLAALRIWSTRHALEFRHSSWFTDEVARRCSAHDIAVCLCDAPDFSIARGARSLCEK